LASQFIAIALTFFAFTTIMSYVFIAESNFNYLTNQPRTILRWLMRLILLATVFYASINESSTAWGIGDIGVGLMAWINFIVILFLYKPTIIALNDYIAQYKQGLNPIFDPEKLNIKNASAIWQRLLKERKS